MDNQQLQQLLDETAARLGVVGAQLAIFDGQDLRQFATGQRNREQDLPVTGDTLFQIGSTTKVFNAATVMSLVDDGTLDLDAPVKNWIKDFKLTDFEAQESISLRHLMSMSAGLDNGSYHDYGRGDDAIERYVAALAGVPHLFAPGTGFGYSNASTNISGHTAERATGLGWEALLSERVLGPLGLTHSACFAEDLLLHPVALGYSKKSPDAEAELIRSWGLPRAAAPAGGTLCTSAGDLVRFAGMFLNKGKNATGDQVLSATAVETMHTPQIELPAKLMAQKWGVGPYWKQWGGYTIHGHSGTNIGGSSMLLWCPEKNVAIATTVNVSNQGYPLADAIFNIVFPQLFGIDKPVFPTPETAEAVDADLTRYTGIYQAYGNKLKFELDDGKLTMTAESDLARMMGIDPLQRCDLIPLGEDRFLPADPALGGNRGWDVAFWGDDGHGRATHFLNGMFAHKKAGV